MWIRSRVDVGHIQVELRRLSGAIVEMDTAVLQEGSQRCKRRLEVDQTRRRGIYKRGHRKTAGIPQEEYGIEEICKIDRKIQIQSNLAGHRQQAISTYQAI